MRRQEIKHVRKKPLRVMSKAKHHGLMSENALQQEVDPVLEVLHVVAKFLVSFMHRGKFWDARRNKLFPAKI